ncbi:MAG: hydrogenase maturation nickel metallochaperone HypA [Desulfobulbales bacterium]
MHELSVCQALMTQIETIASDNQATRVASITLGIGPLSGIEERLLKHAFPVASAGSVAEGAELFIRTTPVRVKCSNCGQESAAKPNRLVCGHCNDWRTDLVSGDELLLIQVELDKADESASHSDALQ